MRKNQNWIEAYLSAADIKEISSEIEKAESKTKGEVVPMVVRSSSTLGQAHVILTLGLFIVMQEAYSFLTNFLEFDIEINEVWPIVGCAVVAIVGGVLLGQVNAANRLILGRKEAQHNALLRAQLEFYHAGINQTRAHTGVLIFVSLFERQVVVLADSKLSEKLPEHVWDKLVGEMSAHLKAGEMRKGLSHAIATCGQILHQHFPAEAHGESELPNELIIKE